MLISANISQVLTANAGQGASAASTAILTEAAATDIMEATASTVLAAALGMDPETVAGTTVAKGTAERKGTAAEGAHIEGKLQTIHDIIAKMQRMNDCLGGISHNPYSGKRRNSL